MYDKGQSPLSYDFSVNGPTSSSILALYSFPKSTSLRAMGIALEIVKTCKLLPFPSQIRSQTSD